MLRRIIFTLMTILLIFLAYMIFNFGSPNALQRSIIPNPDHDLYLILAIGFSVFFLKLLIQRNNDRHKGG